MSFETVTTKEGFLALIYPEEIRYLNLKTGQAYSSNELDLPLYKSPNNLSESELQQIESHPFLYIAKEDKYLQKIVNTLQKPLFKFGLNSKVPREYLRLWSLRKHINISYSQGFTLPASLYYGYEIGNVKDVTCFGDDDLFGLISLLNGWGAQIFDIDKYVLRFYNSLSKEFDVEITKADFTKDSVKPKYKVGYTNPPTRSEELKSFLRVAGTVHKLLVQTSFPIILCKLVRCKLERISPLSAYGLKMFDDNGLVLSHTPIPSSWVMLKWT